MLLNNSKMSGMSGMVEMSGRDERWPKRFHHSMGGGGVEYEYMRWYRISAGSISKK